MSRGGYQRSGEFLRKRSALQPIWITAPALQRPLALHAPSTFQAPFQRSRPVLWPDPPFKTPLDPTWGVLATGSVKPMTGANQAKLSINEFFRLWRNPSSLGRENDQIWYHYHSPITSLRRLISTAINQLRQGCESIWNYRMKSQDNDVRWFHD